MFCNAFCEAMQSQYNYKSTSQKAHLFDVAQPKLKKKRILIKDDVISAENETTCEKEAYF